MRGKWLVAVAAAVMACTGFAGTAAATGTATLSLASCALNGGVRTVPAGTDVVMRTGWLAKNAGLVRAAIGDSTIGVTANGTPVEGSWGPIVDGNGGKVAFWSVDLGAVTAPVVVAATWTLAHPIPDLLTFDADGRPFLFAGTLYSGSCTIVPV